MAVKSAKGPETASRVYPVWRSLTLRDISQEQKQRAQQEFLKDSKK